ncbi:MAG: rhodanese-like domain-containing protein, partial [Myxococcota bacterium]
DVREPFEAELARIEGARLIPLGQLEGAFGELEDWRDRPIVVHCHHGPRSRQACQLLISKGFSHVENLDGGIDAWALDVDPSVGRY